MTFQLLISLVGAAGGGGGGGAVALPIPFRWPQTDKARRQGHFKRKAAPGPKEVTEPLVNSCKND